MQCETTRKKQISFVSGKSYCFVYILINPFKGSIILETFCILQYAVKCVNKVYATTTTTTTTTKIVLCFYIYFVYTMHIKSIIIINYMTMMMLMTNPTKSKVGNEGVGCRLVDTIECIHVQQHNTCSLYSVWYTHNTCLLPI